mgnify:CR=1 FL=1
MVRKNLRLVFPDKTIKEINKETVVLDLNHPLAGIPIEFKVKIVNIYE